MQIKSWKRYFSHFDTFQDQLTRNWLLEVSNILTMTKLWFLWRHWCQLMFVLILLLILVCISKWYLFPWLCHIVFKVTCQTIAYYRPQISKVYENCISGIQLQYSPKSRQDDSSLQFVVLAWWKKSWYDIKKIIHEVSPAPFFKAFKIQFRLQQNDSSTVKCEFHQLNHPFPSSVYLIWTVCASRLAERLLRYGYLLFWYIFLWVW